MDNVEFSIYQSDIPTKMEIPIGMEISNQGSSSIEVFLQNSFLSPRKNPFQGFKGKNLYNHLRSFEQMCSTRSYSDLSPFSSAGKAKAWYFQQ
jgi:hypothetical protein